MGYGPYHTNPYHPTPQHTTPYLQPVEVNVRDENLGVCLRQRRQLRLFAGKNKTRKTQTEQLQSMLPAEIFCSYQVLKANACWKNARPELSRSLQRRRRTPGYIV